MRFNLIKSAVAIPGVCVVLLHCLNLGRVIGRNQKCNGRKCELLYVNMLLGRGLQLCQE